MEALSYCQLMERCLMIERKLESVVAENAGLRHLLDKIGETGNANFGRTSLPTPATDAILAEVRASGVEMFASHLRTNDNGASVCKMIALGADEFAAQLRQVGAE